MVTHPFGYVAVILLQQALILGLVWAVVHFADDSRRERRRFCSAKLISKASATNDLAALAVQLSKVPETSTAPIARRARVRFAQEQRV